MSAATARDVRKLYVRHIRARLLLAWGAHLRGKEAEFEMLVLSAADLTTALKGNGMLHEDVLWLDLLETLTPRRAAATGRPRCRSEADSASHSGKAPE